MKKNKESSKNYWIRRAAIRNLASFKELTKNLVSLGFNQITEKTLKRNAKRFNLTPPSSKRIKQTKDQVSFEKWFEDYCIVVHTSFNPNLGKKGEFASKGGSGWVLVTENVTKRVYVRQFYRRVNMDNFIKNIFYEAAFLVNRLEQRPHVDGTPLLYNIKQTHTETFWVSPLNKRRKKSFYLGVIPNHLMRHFYALDYRVKYYQRKVRLPKVVKNLIEGKSTVRSRDERKIWNFFF